MGTIYANQVPFNVQNTVGNWLQLIGQAILTYNAQQQLIQNGNGEIYGCQTDSNSLEKRVETLEKELSEIKKLLGC